MTSDLPALLDRHTDQLRCELMAYARLAASLQEIISRADEYMNNVVTVPTDITPGTFEDLRPAVAHWRRRAEAAELALLSAEHRQKRPTFSDYLREEELPQ